MALGGEVRTRAPRSSRHEQIDQQLVAATELVASCVFVLSASGELALASPTSSGQIVWPEIRVRGDFSTLAIDEDLRISVLWVCLLWAVSHTLPIKAEAHAN
jgi:hypothetical protein